MGKTRERTLTRERTQVTLVTEWVGGQRVLRVLWQDKGRLRTRTLRDTPENWAAASALVSALAEGREEDACLDAQRHPSQELKPSDSKVQVTDSSAAVRREDFRMTEEQWTAMKDRMVRAAERHRENLEVLDARYQRSLISLALELATKSQGE